MISRTSSDSTDLPHRVGDLLLPVRRRILPDADAEVADHRKAERCRRRSGIGIGAGSDCRSGCRTARAPCLSPTSPSARRRPTPVLSRTLCRCIRCSACRPATQQWFATSVFDTATTVPVASYTSTRAGPYGADCAPIESFRGGCTYFRSSSSTIFHFPRVLVRK